MSALVFRMYFHGNYTRCFPGMDLKFVIKPPLYLSPRSLTSKKYSRVVVYASYATKLLVRK
jgi:hypothetical protein